MGTGRFKTRFDVTEAEVIASPDYVNRVTERLKRQVGAEVAAQLIDGRTYVTKMSVRQEAYPSGEKIETIEVTVDVILFSPEQLRDYGEQIYFPGLVFSKAVFVYGQLWYARHEEKHFKQVDNFGRVYEYVDQEELPDEIVLELEMKWLG